MRTLFCHGFGFFVDGVEERWERYADNKVSQMDMNSLVPPSVMVPQPEISNSKLDLPTVPLFPFIVSISLTVPLFIVWMISVDFNDQTNLPIFSLDHN